jgi:hypothetical protein
MRKHHLAAVAILFLTASPIAFGQSVNWTDFGSPKVNTQSFVGIGTNGTTTGPFSALHLLYPSQGVGINFRLYEYTYFGTVWSSFHTVLGGNVKASEPSNVRMEYAVTHPSLVTSDKPGTAMSSQPVDLGGIKMHRPGTIIGKALEPLSNGEGDILVLLSLQ